MKRFLIVTVNTLRKQLLGLQVMLNFFIDLYAQKPKESVYKKEKVADPHIPVLALKKR